MSIKTPAFMIGIPQAKCYVSVLSVWYSGLQIKCYAAGILDILGILSLIKLLFDDF